MLHEWARTTRLAWKRDAPASTAEVIAESRQWLATRTDIVYLPPGEDEIEPAERTARHVRDHLARCGVEHGREAEVRATKSGRRATEEVMRLPKWPAMRAHAVVLHVMHHNFVRVEPFRRVTPAMMAGVADRTWIVEDLLALLETEEQSEAALPRTETGRGGTRDSATRK